MGEFLGRISDRFGTLLIFECNTKDFSPERFLPEEDRDFPKTTATF